MKESEQESSFYDFFIPLTTKKVIVFLAIIGIILFFNGLFNSFVADDPPEITQNPIIHSIQNFPQFFSGGLFYAGAGQKLSGYFYRPVQTVFFSLMYTFFGPNYFVFHLFQVLLFIANACFLFVLFKNFFGKSIAFVLSLVFLVHPINSESAYYISATQEVLFFFFGIVALWILKNYQSQKALLLISICLLCSILSKETGILFFFISLLHSLLYHKKKFLLLFAYLSPGLILYFILRFSAIGLVTETTKNAPIQQLSLVGRMMNIPEMFLFYIKTFFYPNELASVYQWVVKQVDFQHFYLPLAIDVMFVGLLFFVGYLVYKKAHKYFVTYIFFLVWFLAGMALHMQLLPLDQTVTDQWFYFPIVGLLGMIGVCMEVLHINLTNRAVLSAIIITLVLLSVRTFVRSFDWRDDFTLATHDLQVSKEAFALEHELSRIYYDKRDYQQAKIHADRSIALYPNVFNYTDLGNAYFYMGNYEKAKTAYFAALKYGDNYVTYDNIAAYYMNHGDPKVGLNFINRALKKYPYDERLWTYKAVLEYNYGDKNIAKTSAQNAYHFDQGEPEIAPIYMTIMSNQPLHFRVGK